MAFREGGPTPPPGAFGEMETAQPAMPTEGQETKPALPEAAEELEGAETVLPDISGDSTLEIGLPEVSSEVATPVERPVEAGKELKPRGERVDDIRERVAERFGEKSKDVQPLSAEALESSVDGMVLALELDPSQAELIDLDSLEMEVSDKQPLEKAEQEKLRRAVGRIGGELFRKNPEAFAKAFGAGTQDLMPRDKKIEMASVWAANADKCGWNVNRLVEKGVLTPEEAIGVIERLPEEQKDAELAKVFKAEPGETLHELRESLERMGEMNQANIDFLKGLSEQFPEQADAIQKRLDSLMDLQDSEPDSLIPLGTGVNAARLARTPGGQSVRKPRVHESGYGTHYASLRAKAVPGKSADTEALAQNFALMMGVKSPEVALQVGPDGTESAQRFEPGAKMAAEIPNMKERADNDPKFRQQLENMAALDVLISNSDRHLGNYMETADGELMSIDKGLAFSDNALDMDEMKDNLLRELRLEGKYDDVPFGKMPKEDQNALKEYAEARMHVSGTNSHPLELLRDRGVAEFSQETKNAIRRVKQVMDQGKDSPLYRMFEVTFGEEGADRQWNRVKQRAESLLDPDARGLPRNEKLFEGIWQSYLDKQPEPEKKKPPEAPGSEISTAALKPKQ